MYHYFAALWAFGFFGGGAGEGTVPPIEPDPVEPSGGSGRRRRVVFLFAR